MNVNDLIKQNGIAYNRSVRKQLKKIHDSLSMDVTDVAANASQYAIKFTPHAQETLKEVSKLSSDLTVALLNAKGDKTLTKKEREDYKSIKQLIDILGNVQFKMNGIIQKSKKMNQIADELVDDSYELSKEIMNAQDKFRAVRKKINAYGAFSNNPRIAMLME